MKVIFCCKSKVQLRKNPGIKLIKMQPYSGCINNKKHKN